MKNVKSFEPEEGYLLVEKVNENESQKTADGALAYPDGAVHTISGNHYVRQPKAIEKGFVLKRKREHKFCYYFSHQAIQIDDFPQNYELIPVNAVVGWSDE